METLEQENARLRRENAELMNDITSLYQEVARLSKAVLDAQANIHLLEETLATVQEKA